MDGADDPERTVVDFIATIVATRLDTVTYQEPLLLLSNREVVFVQFASVESPLLDGFIEGVSIVVGCDDQRDAITPVHAGEILLGHEVAGGIKVRSVVQVSASVQLSGDRLSVIS
ncbi:hypothetical protein MICABA_02648 [Microbacterium sp. T2.11-28]|nr:hypothetical protein MICABA_02648 [Microbacterium sp. T2.11-28]